MKEKLKEIWEFLPIFLGFILVVFIFFCANHPDIAKSLFVPAWILIRNLALTLVAMVGDLTTAIIFGVLGVLAIINIVFRGAKRRENWGKF